jgi:hypothetical protein
MGDASAMRCYFSSCTEEYKGKTRERKIGGCRWVRVDAANGLEQWVCPKCVNPIWKEIKRGAPSGSWDAFEWKTQNTYRDEDFYKRLAEQIRKELEEEGCIIPDDEDAMEV